MPIDPELLAEAQRRGLSSARPAVDPELLAEARRRGLPGVDNPTILSQFKKNLLATKAPDDFGGKMARSLPATIGAGIGAAAMTPTGPLGMAGGAYIGGVAGEGLRNAASGLSNLFTEQGPPTAEQGINDMRHAGVDQMEGQMLGSAVLGEPMVEGVYKPAARAVANTLKDKTAAVYKMFAGIPEAMTRHAIARGPKEILTAANAEPVMQQTALEGMRAAAIGQKKAAGELVGTAENNFLASPASRTLFDTAPIGGAVRQELTRPVFDPTVSEYGGAANEKGALEALAGKLESGPATGRTLQGLKTNLNRGVDWNGSPIPNPSPDLQRVTKGVSEQLRGTLANADPQGLGIANPNYHEAAGVYSGYQKPLGDVPKPSVNNDKDTINRLRIAFGKGDMAEGITNFDKTIAESRAKSLAVREQLIPPSTAAPDAAPSRAPILARKEADLEAMRAAVEAPAPSPATPPIPERTPTAAPVRPSTQLPARGLQSELPPTNPARIVQQPLTGGSELTPMTPGAPQPYDPLMQAPRGYPRNVPEGGPVAPANYQTPAEAKLEELLASRRPAPAAPEAPLTPVERLRAAAARVQAEKARAALTPVAEKPPVEVPWQKRPEGPGWLDQPETTPGRDFQDAVTSAAFHGKSDPMRAPSSTLLRVLGALGPATAARWGLKVGQTGVQAARYAAPPKETLNLLIPRLLAELRRSQNEELK